MILAQLILYRYARWGIGVHVVMAESHPREGYFSLRHYTGGLEKYAVYGTAKLRRGRLQRYVGRFAMFAAFDEHVNRVIHKQRYTCARDGIYRPTEDAPLAVDIARAMRIARSRSGERRSTTSPDFPLTPKRRLLEFTHS